MKNLINVSIPIVLAIKFGPVSKCWKLQYLWTDIRTDKSNQSNWRTKHYTTSSTTINQLINKCSKTTKNKNNKLNNNLQQSNQTQQQANQSKQQQDPEMNEKLLNYTNVAILA